jgi:1-acyl-sn-glycerol-3-phosphate acyltransferase
MPVDQALGRDRWYVVISNHQGWSDILVLQDTFLDRIPPLKFFVKQQLIWIPFLGVAMWLLGFPYVRRYSREATARDPSLRRHDLQSTQRASESFKYRPTSVLTFMEGTRFTEEKHRSQQSKYRHLLAPKTGGFGYVVAGLGKRIDRVLDVTIVYPDGAPTFWEFISGQCRRVRVEVDSRPAPKLDFESADTLSPASRDALHGWVDDLWCRKDHRIDELRNGT